MLHTFKKKVEAYAGAGIKVPDAIVKKVLPESAAKKGSYYLPLGMKALIDDVRRFQEGKSDKLDTHIRRDVTVDEVVAHERLQKKANAFHTLADAFYKSYRRDAAGLAKDLAPIKNLYGQDMHVSHRWGSFTITAYFMPKELGEYLTRQDLEGKPSITEHSFYS